MVLQGEVLTPEQRIQELQQEIEELRGYGGGSAALTKVLGNPGALQGLLNLSPEQVQNVKALLVGAGTGAIVKYFGKHVGDELAAIAGAAITAYLAKKVIGK